jgi:Lysyl oxidase/Ricin-type beta-trefoil lectin domain-like/Secretion system C-terminal sorting domain/SprB repeat
MKSFFYYQMRLLQSLLCVLLFAAPLTSLNAQPDLMVVQEVIKNTLVYEQRNFSDQCLMKEKCIGQLGAREILRFSTEIRNIGTTDYFIGKPPIDPLMAHTQFIWDECHRHWHFRAYAKYGLYDGITGAELPTSFKNGFCVEDLGKFNSTGVPKYTCDNQGISVGCYDKYDLNLPCQWIDITNVPSGIYKLVVDVNWMKQKDNNGRDELNYNNNTATVCFKVLRGNATTVTVLDCDTNIGGGVVPPSRTGVVTVYDIKDYAGNVLSFNQGTYNAADLGVLNLNISALTVMNGFQVRACRADGYCRIYTANTPFVGTDMDNKIVSLEISAKTTVSPNCNMAVTATPTPATCVGNDGKINLTANGGTAPYQASIDGAATFSSTLIFGGLAEGAHYANVRDSLGCITRKDFTIVKNCTPPTNCDNVLVYMSVIPATCNGNDGILDKLVLGGVAPYQFSIDGKAPQNEPSFPDLTVGAHYVTIKDNVGCNVRKDFTVTKNCAPVCTLDITAKPTNATCANNDGKVTITLVGGTAPFNYAIDGKPAQATNTFSGLSVGSHTVVVTDKNDCKDNATFAIAKTCTPPPNCTLVATAKGTNTTCLGTDGKVTITATGGTAPFTYAIDGKTAQTTNVFAGLTVGNHTVIVKDNNNCSDDVVFTIGKTCCTLDATAKPTNATCAANDGKVTITLVGGTAPFDYAIDGKPAQATNTFSGLSVGNHTVVVTDKNDCKDNATFAIAKTCTPPPNCTLVATAKGTNTTCLGTDGKATITATGGTAPFTYAIDGKTAQTTNVFAGLTVGNHTVIVKDKNNCSDDVVFSIGKTCCTLDATAKPTNATCAANDGKVTITLVGGTAPFHYAIDGKPAQTANTFSGLSVASHSVIVKDNNNCTDNVTFAIAKTCTPTPCTLNAIAKATNATCAGNDGKANIMILGGVAPFTFTLDGKAVPTINDFVKLTVGNHTIIVKDKNNCTDNIAITIGKDCCTLDATAQPTNATCAANDGKVTISTTGGTAPFTYAIDGKPAQTSNSFAALTVGSHSMVVKDKNSCIDNVTFNIAKNCPPPPCTLNAIAKATNATCAGNDGKANVMILGGTAPFTFTLDGKVVPTINDFVKLTVGNHTIIVKDKNNCTDNIAITVGKDCCTLDATAQPTPATCAANDGKVTISTTSGTAPFTYAIDGKPAQTSNSFAALTVGSHTMVVKDKNSCIDNVTFNITKNCLPPPCTLNAIAKATNATCAGNDGKAVLTITGGTAPFTYAIDGKSSQATGSFVGLTVGNHTVIVKDKNNCTDAVVIAIGKTCCTLAATTKTTNATCDGKDGKVTVLTTTGGTAPFTYAIDGKPAQTSTNFTGLTVGSHKIIVKDKTDCTYTATFNIGTTCIPVSFDPQKCYRLVFSHSGKVLDVPWSSKRNGTYLHQWTWNNQPNQMWKIQKLSNGYYKIINVGSGKAIDLAGWHEYNGAEIVQWEYWDNTNVQNINQQWKIENEGGRYQISSRHTGKVFDLQGTLPQIDGAKLVQWTNIPGLADQRLKIEEVPCVSNSYTHYRNATETDSRFTIYPNPSRGEVHITLDATFAEQLEKVRVYDVTGKIMMETDTRSEAISFEILQDGFYVVALQTKNGSIITRKLIINNKEE